MAEKVGAYVLATDQGLGYLAKAFYDHGLIHKVALKPHTSRLAHPEWYREEDVLAYSQLLLSTCSTIVFFETPFDWRLIPMARERGIKTVLMPMYECTTFPFPYAPDVVVCPSLLDYQFYSTQGVTCVHLPVPVEVEWKQRERAKVFVHNAGNGGLGGRNGTKELLEAMPYVKSPLTLIVRSQVPLRVPQDPRIKLELGTIEPAALWSHGDVFVFPEMFNGLSLPLQEAYAAGMLVMAGARYPMTEWLPTEPLIPVDRYTKERLAVAFESAHYDPLCIAARMDEWYDADITAFSIRGRDFAHRNSWSQLKGAYEALLSR